MKKLVLALSILAAPFAATTPVLLTFPFGLASRCCRRCCRLLVRLGTATGLTANATIVERGAIGAAVTTTVHVQAGPSVEALANIIALPAYLTAI